MRKWERVSQELIIELQSRKFKAISELWRFLAAL